eukprot:GILK01002677.1.p3 GENE.GILK01002677.1~~GILK01002677.1.p3  ORF type:complete len:110 (+),score=12.08 GILK01002677.1:188-517(+)
MVCAVRKKWVSVADLRVPPWVALLSALIRLRSHAARVLHMQLLAKLERAAVLLNKLIILPPLVAAKIKLAIVPARLSLAVLRAGALAKLTLLSSPASILKFTNAARHMV